MAAPSGPRLASYKYTVATDNARILLGDVHGNVYHGDVYQAKRDVGGQYKCTMRLLEVHLTLTDYPEEILASLRFNGMEMYHQRPLESFPGTYEWIFDGTSTNFKQWLTASNDTFWVNGKAGSGKSCLMKLIVEHPRTMELLRAWAGGEVTIAAFFFWAAGSELERSQLGLMRSILYQLLQQFPKAIQTCMTERWAATERRPAYHKPWSRIELQSCLQTILRHECITSSFCFFIDGLDEFEGDYQDLIEFLDSMTRSDKVKMCVSSRAWNVFLAAYGSQDNIWQVRLHDLTRQDMDLFINARFQDDPRFRALIVGCDEPRELRALVNRLRDMAEGVFLWVSLAIKTLRRGLNEGDSLLILNRRLDLLPQELDAMLQHMFDSIEPAYRQLAARSLLILNRSDDDEWYGEGHGTFLPLLWLCHLGEELERESCLSPSFRTNSSQDVGLILGESARMTRAWCKDFVEVLEDNEIDKQSRWDLRDLIVPGSVFSSRVTQQGVRYGHRTIFDFIGTKERNGTLQSMAGVAYDPSISICRALTRCANFAISTWDYHDVVTQFIYNSRYVPVSRQSDLVPLVERLIDVGLVLATRFGSEIFDFHKKCWRWQNIPVLSAFSMHPRYMGSVMLRAHALMFGQERLFWTLFFTEPQYNTREAKSLWLECASFPGLNDVALWSDTPVAPLIGSMLKLYDESILITAPLQCGGQRHFSTWFKFLGHYPHTRDHEIIGVFHDVSAIVHALAWFVSCGANPDDLDQFPQLCKGIITWRHEFSGPFHEASHSPEVYDTAELRWHKHKPWRTDYDRDSISRYRSQIEQIVAVAQACVSGQRHLRSETF